ncbi:NAD(P)H nitroreductase [Actinomadura cremea]|nr:NAD(P)H nitroreductase [Actinomadura cremea]
MRTRITTPVPPEQLAEDARAAIGDAVWAPSVHNTQPWRFGVHGARISVRADADRRLGVADPAGREMLISCGAALYNLRLALRALGYAPDVRLLPDPDRPHLLADVHMNPGEPPDGDIEDLHGRIRCRRTHRGGFGPGDVSDAAIRRIVIETETEGARLIQAVDAHVAGALAALTDAAEHVQRRTPSYATEIARWAPAPGTRRSDGVQEGGYPRETPQTEPHFAARDFARGRDWGVRGPAEASDQDAGLVMLLVTETDDPADWIRAGQSLQRLLLRADQHGLSVAFHTQALEVPELRNFIRTRFCAGRHPQSLLRIGAVSDDAPGLETVRRPVEEVTNEERW